MILKTLVPFDSIMAPYRKKCPRYVPNVWHGKLDILVVLLKWVLRINGSSYPKSIAFLQI